MTITDFKADIQAQTVTAMKEKNQLRVETLRSITNSITVQEKKTPGKDINHIDILSTMSKQRTQSIDAYTAGGNIEAADKERQELVILQEFLPKTMSDTELVLALNEVVNSITPVPTIKEMGKVVATFRTMYPGQDMGKVSGMVKTILA